MDDEDGYLKNKLLIAMPSLADPYFSKAVIYVCEHNSQGAIGLIINQPLEQSLSLVFEQMSLEVLAPKANLLPLLFGGPLQPERGFVIHRPSGHWRSSIDLENDVSVTTSNDIIKALAQGTGPGEAMVALGYAGWEGEQLDEEVKQNTWLTCPFDASILYDVPFEQRWQSAANSIGIDLNLLSSDIGHA